MSQTKLSVDRFVKVLEAAGIDEQARQRLHREFERIDPEGHEAFLAALNLSAEESQHVRATALAG